jgi:gas vesicle protein
MLSANGHGERKNLSGVTSSDTPPHCNTARDSRHGDGVQFVVVGGAILARVLPRNGIVGAGVQFIDAESATRFSQGNHRKEAAMGSGSHSESSTGGGWPLLAGLAVGTAAGFVLGLMLAPRDRSDAAEGEEDAYSDLREKTNDMLENLRGNTEAILNQTRAAIEERMSLLNEAVEAGRRAAEYKRAELIEQDNA